MKLTDFLIYSRKLIAYVQRVLSDEEAASPATVSSTTSSDSDSEDDEDEDLTTEDDESEHLKSARGTGMRQDGHIRAVFF